MRLKDKVIVVTGSTKGIGRGITLMLASEGAKVVVSGRSEKDGISVVNDIGNHGGEACFIQADVSRVDDCRKLIDAAVQKYSRIDGLINNAAIFPRIFMMDVDEKAYDSIMATNLKGAFFCTQQALKYMKEERSGSIVNIGSTHWKMSSEELPVYGLAKGGLHTLTQHVAHHFAKYGIRSNWITVGWVLSDTEMRLTAEAGHDMEWLQKIMKQIIPLGQFQKPEDLAYACVYLLSDESAQVTGTDLEVTGGMLDG